MPLKNNVFAASLTNLMDMRPCRKIQIILDLTRHKDVFVHGPKVNLTCKYAGRSQILQHDSVGEQVHVPVGHARLQGGKYCPVGSQDCIVDNLLLFCELSYKNIIIMGSPVLRTKY